MVGAVPDGSYRTLSVNDASSLRCVGFFTESPRADGNLRDVVRVCQAVTAARKSAASVIHDVVGIGPNAIVSPHIQGAKEQSALGVGRFWRAVAAVAQAFYLVACRGGHRLGIGSQTGSIGIGNLSCVGAVARYALSTLPGPHA